MTRLHLCFILAIALLLSACQTQVPSVPHGQAPVHFTGDTVTELPLGVWKIYQDTRFDRWIGSDTSGLYRITGRTIIRYTSKNGLEGRRVYDIQEDKNGHLLIQTDAGIFRWNQEKFEHLQVEFPSTYEEGWRLTTDDLWFMECLKHAGPCRYDGEHLYQLQFPKHKMEEAYYKMHPDQAWSPYSIYTIYKDLQGDMWFGTAAFGLCRYDGTRVAWMFEDDITNTPSGGSFGIRSILEGPNNNFWICHTGSRFRMETATSDSLDYSTLRYKRLSGIPHFEESKKLYVMSMLYDRLGNLWMATYAEGLWKYDGQKMIEIPTPPGSTLFTMYQDRRGKLLIGTHQMGLLEFNEEGAIPFAIE